MTVPAQPELIYDAIRDAGGRVTVSTRAVVEALLDGDRHLTAEDIIAETERRTPGIAESTIYRVLQRLDELGVVEHVHSGHHATFYHLRDRGHAHLVCTDCGAIIDVPDRVLTTVSTAVARDYGFTVDLHHTALNGRCADCRARWTRWPPPSGHSASHEADLVTVVLDIGVPADRFVGRESRGLVVVT